MTERSHPPEGVRTANRACLERLTDARWCWRDAAGEAGEDGAGVAVPGTAVDASLTRGTCFLSLVEFAASVGLRVGGGEARRGEASIKLAQCHAFEPFCNYAQISILNFPRMSILNYAPTFAAVLKGMLAGNISFINIPQATRC